MALLNSLPNPLVAGAAENIADVTANLEALRASVNAVSAEQINTGAVGSSELATSLYNSLVPLGTVLDWYPPAAASAPWTAFVPTGFYLCDGTAWASITNDLGFSTGNIPNLTGVLISGATPATARDVANGVGGVRGSSSRTITTAQLPSHNHSVDGSGAHSHSGTTENDVGPGGGPGIRQWNTSDAYSYYFSYGYSANPGGSYAQVNAYKNHTHTFSTNSVGHSHTGGYTGGAEAIDVTPASVGLLRIMKVRSAG